MEACAQDLIDAVHNRDSKAAAAAIQAAFECAESEPHAENEDHVSPHSYEASKE